MKKLPVTFTAVLLFTAFIFASTVFGAPDVQEPGTTPDNPTPITEPVVEPTAEPQTDLPLEEVPQETDFDDYTEPPPVTEEVTAPPIVDDNTNEDPNYYDDEGEEDHEDYYIEEYVHPTRDYNDFLENSSPLTSYELYDTGSKRNNKLFNKNDWGKIALGLFDNDDDSDDFSKFQQSASSDRKGQWILIGGIALILLGVAGCIYFGLYNNRGAKQNMYPANAVGGMPKDQANIPEKAFRPASKSDYGDRYSTRNNKLKKGTGSNRYRHGNDKFEIPENFDR